MVNNYEDVVKNVRFEIETFLTKNKQLKSVVLGVSGGIDSALVAVLLKPVCDNLNVSIIGRSITIETNTLDEISRAQKIGEIFCHNFNEVDLTSHYHAIKRVDTDMVNLANLACFEDSKDSVTYKIRMGNIKARLRMIHLYNLASKYHGLTIGTDNETELQLGFYTLHGDHFDYCPIQHLWKTEVYAVSQWLVDNELDGDGKVALQECIDATATDGLGITNSDLEQILPNFVGTSKEGYRVVDEILIDYLDNGVGDSTNPVIDRHLKSAFKRSWPTRVGRSSIVKNEY